MSATGTRWAPPCPRCHGLGYETIELPDQAPIPVGCPRCPEQTPDPCDQLDRAGAKARKIRNRVLGTLTVTAVFVAALLVFTGVLVVPPLGGLVLLAALICVVIFAFTEWDPR